MQRERNWKYKLGIKIIGLLLLPFVWWQIRKNPNWRGYSDEWKKERIKAIIHYDEVKAELGAKNAR